MFVQTTDSAEWTAARIALLKREKEFTRQRDELAAARRALPALRISGDYVFEGPNGKESLLELFDGRSQLIVYHFMYGADWGEGCTSCSFWADNLNGIDIHLAHRDISFLMMSTADFATITTYRKRMAWGFKWVSTAGNSFNHDMNVSFTPDQLEAGSHTYNYKPEGFNGPEAPGLTVFRRAGDAVFLTYGTFARGLDGFNGAYHLMDLTPKGRDEGGLDWSMQWLRRRDQY